MKNQRIFIITGEASGDLHAANLIRAVHTVNPNIKFFGMGGKNMQAAGAEILVDIKEMSVLGLTEIILHLPKIYRIFKKLERVIATEKPDLVILVDCPGFNLRFAKTVKKYKLPLLYYISPQLWAWHQSRVQIVKQCVDVMAVIFPFEVDFYKNFSIEAKFVGHPLATNIKPSLENTEAKKLFSLSTQSTTHNPVIGLLPGSRKSEINRILPVMLESAQQLNNKFPQAEFILPLASTLTEKDLAPYLNKISFPIKVIANHTYDVINVCDAIMVTSGTATLEVAMLQKPMAVIYKTSAFTAFIGRRVIKVPFLCINNIIAGKSIIKEFIQQDATADNIVAEIEKILEDTHYRKQMIFELIKIKNQLSVKIDTSIANLVMQILLSPKSSPTDLALEI